MDQIQEHRRDDDSGKVRPSPGATPVPPVTSGGDRAAFRVLAFAGSVRLGIVLLNLIVVVSVAGMLIPQHNVAGFDSFYAELGEFERSLLTFLGVFDIYHSWYFIALLALLALNIILASIDRFPRTLRLIRNPNLEPSAAWIGQRDLSESLMVPGNRDRIADRFADSLRKNGFRKLNVAEQPGRTIFFAESGAWNRLGAYPVHVALLTILLGGALSAMFGFTGEMTLSRGQVSDRISSTVFRDGRSQMTFQELPFSVKCTDMEQKLIDPNGSIEVNNSLDWITYLETVDDSGTRNALVSLNQPLDYRGYRFFHSEIVPIGKARNILVRVAGSGNWSKDVSLSQGGSASLPDGFGITFVDFRSNMNPESREANENSTSFENPAAIVELTAPSGERRTAFVFAADKGEEGASLNSFEGLDLSLLEFERVADAHVLLVQYDPGVTFLYAGFFLLTISLAAVFMFSHKRVWVSIEDSEGDEQLVTIGGDTNRDHLAFEEKMRRIAAAGLKGGD